LPTPTPIPTPTPCAIPLGTLYCSASWQDLSPRPTTPTWLQTKGTLIFHDAFERDETGNRPTGIGNGWNSATADRVPQIKQADLDEGVMKIASATKEAGHAAHIHHEAGFADGGVIVRFKFPGLNKAEGLQLGFVDRELKGVHAGHMCYAILSPTTLTLKDSMTGEMNLALRKQRAEAAAAKQKLPAEIEALLKKKSLSTSLQNRHEMARAHAGHRRRRTPLLPRRQAGGEAPLRGLRP
jgi:hypothetical protein